MKTATEWANEFNHGCARHRPDHISLEEIQQIQLDAIKEGMNRAVDKSPERHAPTPADLPRGQDYNIALDDYTRAILTTASILTLKDL
jgi:hypothetical protein